MFRFRRNFISWSKPCSIINFKITRELDDAGNHIVTVGYEIDTSGVLHRWPVDGLEEIPSTSVSSLSISDLPNYTDYKLSNLINAGIPLNTINIDNLISSSPTDSDLDKINDYLDKVNEKDNQNGLTD